MIKIIDKSIVDTDDKSVAEAVEAFIKQMSGNGTTEQDNSTKDAIKQLQSELACNDGEEPGFHPVEPCVEPWSIPKWDQIDSIIKDLQLPKENESKYERYQREFWLRYYSELKVDFASEPIIKFACGINKELSVMEADELIRYTSELSFDVVCDVLNFVLPIKHNQTYRYTHSSYRDVFVILEYLAHKNTEESKEG